MRAGRGDAGVQLRGLVSAPADHRSRPRDLREPRPPGVGRVGVFFEPGVPRSGAPSRRGSARLCPAAPARDRRRTSGSLPVPSSRPCASRAACEALPAPDAVLSRCGGRSVGFERRPKGLRPDWERPEEPKNLARVAVFVAGGLDPETVGRGDPAASIRPASTSRRESRARRESRIAEKLERFFEAVRAAEADWTERDRAERRGYFGAYGGRFAPETLMAPLEELEQAFAKPFRRDRRVPQPSSTSLLRDYAGRPTPVTYADRLTERRRRCADRSEARGPPPHRRAQAQQRARAGSARAADGKGARRRRDRRRPARRGDGGGRGEARSRVPRLHGRDRHGPPGAERGAHAAARRARSSASTRARRP